jgi:hypothetical protein
MHLSDAELDRITTTTTLTLGSLQTDKVYFDGVSHTDTPADVYAIAMDTITFQGAATSFVTRVGVHADKDIVVKSSVTVSGGSLTYVADADCDNGGQLRVSSAGSVSTTNNVFWIQANDVVLSGPLDSGSVATHFIGCSGVSLDIGDGYGTGSMKISGAELRFLTSTNLTFNAESASITVFDTVSEDTTTVSDRITFNAHANLVFMGSSVFKSVRGVAPKLNISGDLKMTESHLVLEATEFIVDSGSWIQSEIGNIYI